jgi:surface antigen
MEGPSGQFGTTFWVEIRVVVTGTNNSSFVSESAPYDGTQFQVGATFNKSWTIRNSGTTTWVTSTYRARRISGSYGPTTINLTTSVGAGSNVTITGSFTAPTTTGTQRATYKMEGPSGQFGTTFWVEIVVVSATGTNGSTFVSEGPPSDGTAFSAGATFTKTWTIRNSGTTTWTTSGYRARRTSGSYGPTTISLSSSVSPNTNVTLTGSFTAPSTTGTHRATYRMEGPAGAFGVNFWVEIVVGGGGGVIGDNYPWSGGCIDCVDSWNFYTRQCTSFVAFRMNNQYGKSFYNYMQGPNGTFGTWGNASSWASTATAIGYAVNSTPTVGSIAYFSSGHVALVAAVSGGNVTLEEYNWGSPSYMYGTRTISASTPTSNIHVAN